MSEKHDAMWGAAASEYIAQQDAVMARLREDYLEATEWSADLLKQIDRLQAALEWYANGENYAHWGAGGCDFGSHVENDRGERARKALAKEGE